MTKHLEFPVYIFMEGGQVTAAVNAESEPVILARVIDYDRWNISSACPVCIHEFTEEDMGRDVIVCPICAWDPAQDNALAAAVAYFGKDAEAGGL